MSAKERIAEYWKMNKKKIYAFCIAFIVVFILKIIGTAFSVLNDEWNKMESPYDIQWEYQGFLISTGIRQKVMREGFSDNNFFSNYLKCKQIYYYELIRKKIPENDLLLDLLLLDTKYLYNLETETNSEELNNIIIANFDDYMIKTSKIKKVDKVLRYEYLNYIVNYFIQNIYTNKNLFFVNFVEKKLKNILADKNYNLPKEAKLIILTKYIKIIASKVFQEKHTYEDMCNDAEYYKLKQTLYETQDFIISNFLSSKSDKFYLSLVEYVMDFAIKMAEFDKKKCSNKRINYPSTEIQINH